MVVRSRERLRSVSKWRLWLAPGTLPQAPLRPQLLAATISLTGTALALMWATGSAALQAVGTVAALLIYGALGALEARHPDLVEAQTRAASWAGLAGIAGVLTGVGLLTLGALLAFPGGPGVTFYLAFVLGIETGRRLGERASDRSNGQTAGR